ncbi:hypothetical protein [Megasphaera sueciensis]|uniref:hypothetical protein n=1 Tax=Megasphaera sueciensis TaxID=349094 RepID=UPI003CFD5452
MTLPKGSHAVINPQAKLRLANQAEIMAFIQGAVYSWCVSSGHTEFSSTVLFGGINKDWNGTPLQALYNWHILNKTADSHDGAGKDVGKLLYKFLYEDETRSFEEKTQQTTTYNQSNEYRWI